VACDLWRSAGYRATLGSRVPNALTLFWLTLAIVDDIGAVLVIALFYSQGVAISWLAGAAGP
jgi:NhaA family Na+:H+ antiporter